MPFNVDVHSNYNSKFYICGRLRKVWRMQLCHRYVRITRLLSAPIAFKNWGLAVHLACNHPCSLISPRKLIKLPPQTD